MKNRSFPINIDDISIERVVSMIADPSLTGVVVTPNVDHICRIYQDSYIRGLYDKATLCVCDSKIIQYLSFFSKRRIKNVVRGSDLTVQLLETFSENDPILIVSSDETHAERVSQLYGLNQVKCYVPPMGFIQNDQEVDKVKQFLKDEKARIVFLAVGSPQQEIVATQYHDECNDKLLICCGNAINFAVGNTKRAPVFMSKVGLEWLYRIVQEPRRMMPRYLANVKIFSLFFIK